MAEKQWIPLESNPEVLTKFGRALGLPESVSFVDVWSLDLLDMVPAPRHAVLLLFPITDRLRAAGEQSDGDQSGTSESAEKPFFCKQTISNACGTIALLHAAINSPVSLGDGSFLNLFLERTAKLSPDERAAALQADSALDAVHDQFAQEGQTPVPNDLDKVDMHFVCFVNHDGTLYQLDGRKDAPIRHGTTCPDSFLADTAEVIRSSFMAADPSEHRFTIVALVDNPE